jgi:phosphoribosylformylglycinamidine synthase
MLGALSAQLGLEIPAIGGKDSMSGTFNKFDVPPTLVSFAVAVSDAERVLSPEFKQTGSTLILLRTNKDEQNLPNYEQFKLNMKRVSSLTEKGKILSASTIGQEGIFVTVFKMAMGNGIGAILKSVSNEDLVSYDYGSLILEIAGTEDAASLFGGLNYLVIGETVGSGAIEIKPLGEPKVQQDDTYNSMIIGLSDISGRWKAPLERIFPVTVPDSDGEEIPLISYEGTALCGLRSGPTVARPRVFIPVFPGTNCEVDMRIAFENAGGQADIVNLINLNPGTLDESIKRMTESIKQSQIVMIPGGFSGGDEPEGSAKFITAVFRNPFVREAITDLLENRDGLMLGICNGFQALIKLGLVPYGRIIDISENTPTLTYNTVGRHVSRIVRTRIASDVSPWLAGTAVGDIFTVPVSHGEGRFVAGDEVLHQLLENGQIATQYVDLSGNPTMDSEHNPNGSRLAIEGITSADGRIFGKMGHSERVGTNLYKNVAGNYDSKIFESGIAYFR